jgi:uncharacterized protein HemY
LREPISEALRLNRNDSDALTVLGSLARARFDWPAASRSAEAAVAADPSNSFAGQRLAELLFVQGLCAAASTKSK